MFRIFGPPGTGKTTRLLDMVERALGEGVPPQKIAFLAFTRKAATEAKERAAKRFGLDPDDLTYFRTLHSLAYRLLGVRTKDVLGKENMDELSRHIGISLSIRVGSDPDEVDISKMADHPILSVIHLARLKKTTLRQEYNNSNIPHSWEEVDFVNRNYNAYKQANMLMDYTDMLEVFVQKADSICPTFEIAFLDEAQDLSPLQWDIAHALDKKSNKMYCAGDDDQAIYRWAGADPDYFIDLDCGAEVLETSYRIPFEVHELAERITSRIHKRYPKKYTPRAERGSVSRVSTMNQLDMAHGSWLIMAQANYMLSPITQDLRSMGYLYERNGHRSISDKLTEAVNGWERMRKGQAVTLHTAQAIYSLMSGNGVRISRGKKIIKAPDDELFTLESLQEHYGLLATKDMIWSEAMDKIGDMDRAYITALLRRGEKFNATPRIKLSTIHGTKGGEADNVALLTDLSNSAMEGMSDDLHRVFYVGVTRAKQNLFIFEPDDYSRAYDL